MFIFLNNESVLHNFTYFFSVCFVFYILHKKFIEDNSFNNIITCKKYIFEKKNCPKLKAVYKCSKPAKMESLGNRKFSVLGRF